MCPPIFAPFRAIAIAACLAAAAAPVVAAAPDDSACARATTQALGAELASLHDVRPQDREVARRLGLDDRLQVVAIDAGSAAAAAGLRVGDVVEALDGEPLPPGARARDTFLAIAEEGGRSRLLRVRRDGEQRVLRLVVRGGCTVRI